MKHTFLSTALLFLVWIAAAQSPVFGLTHCLSMDTTINVSEPPNQGGSYSLLGAHADDQFLYSSSFTYASKANEHHGTLYAIDLSTYVQQTYNLPFPDDIQNWQRRASSCVLLSISASGNDLLMTVSQRLIWYKKKNNIYKLERSEVLPNVVQAYLNGKKTYAFVEDFYRSSLSWLRFENEKDTKGTILRQWKYKCAFLTQFHPNKYIQVGENEVLIMPPGERYILEFTPDGKLMDSISFDFPEWIDFPQELVDAANACPYGAERIYKALNMGMKKYMFARSFDVLSDSLVFVTMNMGGDSYNSNTLVMRLYRDKEMWNKDFLNIGNADTVRGYDDSYYPFYYYGCQEHVLSYPYQGKLLQLLKLPEHEKYKGLNALQYREKVLDSYKYDDPVLKLRVLSPKGRIVYHNYENEIVGLEDFTSDKVLMMVNVQPQCSACQKHLLQYFSSLASADVAFSMLYLQTDNYLDRRNLRKDVAQFSKMSYTDLYMIDGVDYSDILRGKSYPAVLLWERGKGVVGFYDTSTIFTNDLNKYEYTDTFLKAMREFFE